MFGLTHRLLQGCAALLALVLSAVGVSRPDDGRGAEATTMRAERTLVIAGELLSESPAVEPTAARPSFGAPPRDCAPTAGIPASASPSSALLLGSARGPRAP